MRYFILLIIFLFSIPVVAQEPFPFRYEKDFLSGDFYKKCRAELRNQLPDSSVAILFTSPERPRSNDVSYIYHQDPNFNYLTGFTSMNSVLMIFKNNIKVEDLSVNEILFIAPRDKEKETWTGRMASLKDASEISGIENCYLTMDLRSFPVNDSMFKNVLYGAIPSGVIDSRKDTLDLFNLIDICKQKFKYPTAFDDPQKLSRILSSMREVKQKEELVLLKKAIMVSCDAHIQMMKAAKAGMTEYQVQAVGEYVFRKNGSEYPGYPSICGGGENSCILHYESNRRTLKDGDMLLMDMGAEYHGYSADVTRTYPVNGKFTQAQKIIYELVEAAHDSAMAACKIGNTFQSPHKAAVAVIKEGLLKLGIIEKESEYNTYFMHGTSHYLGLDVHDAGTFSLLKEGNVITVEPGIYIPYNSPCDPKWWNIGIRIEDDVLITAKGYENLSAACPIGVEQIEKIMAEPFFLENGGK